MCVCVRASSISRSRDGVCVCWCGGVRACVRVFWCVRALSPSSPSLATEKKKGVGVHGAVNDAAKAAKPKP